MTIKSPEPVFTAFTISPGRSTNDCPWVYLVLSQWFPTDTYRVSSPCWKCLLEIENPVEIAADSYGV